MPDAADLAAAEDRAERAEAERDTARRAFDAIVVLMLNLTQSAERAEAAWGRCAKAIRAREALDRVFLLANADDSFRGEAAARAEFDAARAAVDAAGDLEGPRTR